MPSRPIARPRTCTAPRRWRVCGRISKGGFYHDGRFATLLDVIAHYATVLKLKLSDSDRSDLVEYLKGI